MTANILSRSLDGVLVTQDGAGERVPVVFDSPHSGNRYPRDFEHAVPVHQLRSAEDMYVDDLFTSAPAHGAAFLRALFPRSYIDVNRHALDIDPDLLAAPWPEELRPGNKTRNGKGLIRSRAQDRPLYGRKLEVAEVMRRLTGYYEPYHEELAALIAARRRDFGSVWHVNCHSWTPPETGRDGGPIRHIDFCLGDRDGTTCDPGFTAFLADTLTDMGYVVRVNRPFKGMELVKRYGRPQEGQHSVQIEINRNLYMDRQSHGRLEQYGKFRENISRLVAAICAYAYKRREVPAPGFPEALPASGS